MFPVLSSVQVKTYHLLISYPLGPRPWLTLFNSSSYTRALDELLQHTGSNVLLIHGDKDEFTSHAKYQEWASDMRGNVEIVEIENGSHFWGGRSGEILVEEVKKRLRD